LGLAPLSAGYAPIGGGGDILRDKPLMMLGGRVGIDIIRGVRGGAKPPTEYQQNQKIGSASI